MAAAAPGDPALRAARRARAACNWAVKMFVIEDHSDERAICSRRRAALFLAYRRSRRGLFFGRPAQLGSARAVCSRRAVQLSSEGQLVMRFRSGGEFGFGFANSPEFGAEKGILLG